MRGRIRAAVSAIAAALFLVCAFGVTLPSLQAQQDERAVRAAYLFNLTRYVTWPGARKQIVIGVAGTSSIGTVFKDILENKVSDGRKVEVVLHPSDAELRKCDIVYVPAASQASLPGLLTHTEGHPILIVGETSRFTRQGGMVGLIRSGDQIQIEVNLEAVHARGLEMSSRLLNLAVLVRTSEVKR